MVLNRNPATKVTIPYGTKLGRYEIRSKLGEGGMGEVYLAQDTKLDRRVAIKFLNQEFSKDVDKLNRFIREARAASALNHPNILTVYEIGETDDKNYIVTELIDGKTLRAHLSHQESFPLNQILKIGVQVCEALSAAHQAGILGVSAVMSGRMVQRGENLTISVELIDATSNKLLWGEQYERKMSDLLATQREIATAITEKLQLKLSDDDAKVAKRYTDSNEAYQLYLKGRFYWNKRTVDGLKQAVVYYKQAIEKDPNFALAYSGVAESYVLYPNYSVAPPKDCMPQAKAAALKALEIDDSLAEAHAALGLYLANYAWNLSAGEKELRRAIELKPNYATAHHWLGNVPLLMSQKFDEAIAEGRRAEELDPLSAIINADEAFNLINARRYDEAIAQCQRAFTVDPNFYYTHYLLGWAYNLKGMHKEAIAALRKSLELNPDPFAKALLINSLVKSGERAEAVKLRDELRSDSTRRYVPSYFLAMAAMALGNKDEAFAQFEKEIAERGAYASGLTIDPTLDELRSDPRFAELTHKIQLGKMD
jgi:tetratricopeptide (TPR) repeat protein